LSSVAIAIPLPDRKMFGFPDREILVFAATEGGGPFLRQPPKKLTLSFNAEVAQFDTFFDTFAPAIIRSEHQASTSRNGHNYLNINNLPA
jgi:hypothetical protein